MRTMVEIHPYIVVGNTCLVASGKSRSIQKFVHAKPVGVSSKVKLLRPLKLKKHSQEIVLEM